MRKVRYDRFAGIDGLTVEDAPTPVPGPDEILVQVRASCINPGSLSALRGASYTPARDIAGTVVGVGSDVSMFHEGDEVLGWLQDWAAHAEYVAVPVQQLIIKPVGLGWDVAGSLFVTPMAGRAGVIAVAPTAGETIVVAGASGGVGYTAAQLAGRTGARVIGITSRTHHSRLARAGVMPVVYGDGVAARVLAAAADAPVVALIDAVGFGYVDLGIRLGIEPQRINTAVDFAAAQRTGARSLGTIQAGGMSALGELAQLAATSQLDIPIAATFSLEDVRDAYTLLAVGKPAGRVLLQPA